jgi:hypothetical protein
LPIICFAKRVLLISQRVKPPQVLNLAAAFSIVKIEIQTTIRSVF